MALVSFCYAYSYRNDSNSKKPFSWSKWKKYNKLLFLKKPQLQENFERDFFAPIFPGFYIVWGNTTRSLRIWSFCIWFTDWSAAVSRWYDSSNNRTALIIGPSIISERKNKVFHCEKLKNIKHVCLWTGVASKRKELALFDQLVNKRAEISAHFGLLFFKFRWKTKELWRKTWKNTA